MVSLSLATPPFRLRNGSLQHEVDCDLSPIIPTKFG
jgi:hypothetical protein